jgi:hypothetical protein
MGVVERLKVKLGEQKRRKAERALARREQKMPTSATSDHSGKGGQGMPPGTAGR